MTRLTDEQLDAAFAEACKRWKNVVTTGEVSRVSAPFYFTIFEAGWRSAIDAIEAELSIRQEMAAFVIARETAFDLPGRPRKELGYIVPAGSVSFPTQEAAHEAHREMGLPLGWVVMRLEQLVATPPQPAPDTVLVPREPTIAMLEAFREADEQRFGPHFHDAYRAMIAAAPKNTP